MELLSVVNVVMSSTAAIAGLRIVFLAGRLVEKVEDHSERIKRLEATAMESH